MKQVYNLSLKIKKSLAENKVQSLLKDLNSLSDVVAKLEGKEIKVRYLAEEIASDNREGAEELKAKVVDVVAKYNSLEDKPEDENKPEKAISDEKSFSVVLDPANIEKLKKVNDASIEYSVTDPATVEVKESGYVKFILECFKRGISVRDVYLKESMDSELRTLLGNAEVKLNLGKDISKEFVEGIIYGYRGDTRLSPDEAEEVKTLYPKVAVLLAL